MAVASCGSYFVNVPIGSTGQGGYKVLIDSSVVYEGTVYNPAAAGSSVSIDCMPVVSCFTPADTGKLSNWGSSCSTASGTFYRNFQINNASNNGYLGGGALVYANTRDASLGTNLDFLQLPVRRIYNGTYLALNGFGTGSLSYSTHWENGRTVANTAGYISGSAGRIAGTLSFSDYNGFKPVSVDMGFNGKYTYDIEIVNCVPKNSFIVYFVNDFGGITPILCDGANNVVVNTERSQMKKYTTISTPQAFGKFNYITSSTRTWKLNTGLVIDDGCAKNMEAFFRSPYVWVYSIDEGKVWSAILTESSYTVKNYNANKMFNYTLTLTDSIELNARAI